jgi:hypothetical protein
MRFHSQQSATIAWEARSVRYSHTLVPLSWAIAQRPDWGWFSDRRMLGSVMAIRRIQNSKFKVQNCPVSGSTVPLTPELLPAHRQRLDDRLKFCIDHFEF